MNLRKTVGQVVVAFGIVAGAAAVTQAASVDIAGGCTGAAPGKPITFTVKLVGDATELAGVQTDISYDVTKMTLNQGQTGTGTCSTTTAARCARNEDCQPPTCPTCQNGETCNRAAGPACGVPASIPDKNGFFGSVGQDAMRGIVVGVSPQNVTPIADGAFFDCTGTIASTATPGATFPLTASNVIAGQPNGTRVNGTGDTATITVKKVPVCDCDCDGTGRVTNGGLLRGLSIIRGQRFLCDCDAWSGNPSNAKLLKCLRDVVRGNQGNCPTG